MSFSSPIWLLALLVVPLALAAHVAARRRARRYAVRFPGVAAVRIAAGTTPAWRRHLPAALVLASMAALALALAKPEHTIAVPIERASIVLVTDHSGSMSANDVDPTRLQAAESAANAFIDQMPDPIRLGVVTYSTAVDQVQPPSTDHGAVRRVIDSQSADGATATGDALQVALDQLAGDRRRNGPAPTAIVLLSDGATTAGRDPVGVAQEAGHRKVPIFTVSLGTPNGVVAGPGFGGVIPVPPDPETLHAIAQASGGRAFTAEDSGRLSSIYKSLGSRLGTRQRKSEMTATFALAGVVLLLGAALTSQRWAGRLP